MNERDLLSSLVLEHWQSHCPTLLSELQSTNQLQERLNETTEQITDLLYELISVRKLEHHRAWELMTQQFLTTEESA